jgi:major membrane immunogen (membrane-anchored lipoprotein)
MKIKLPTLTKTQKIIAGFAIIVAISLLVFGCETSVKTDSTINDTTLVDSVKIDTIGKN